MTVYLNIATKPEDKDTRLTKWFEQRYPQVSQSQVQKHVRKGFIRINDKKIKLDYVIKSGDIVRIHPVVMDEADKNTPVRGADVTSPKKTLVSGKDLDKFRTSILYTDADIIAINKPSGLAVQGGSGIKMSLDDILDALAETDKEERMRLVHRLDKDTSGVLLLARNRKSAARLTKIFRDKQAQKIYWALVVGRPNAPEGKIDTPLQKKRQENGDEHVMTDSSGGKDALTYFKVVDHVGKMLSWLALSPVTGRTHQLRVHCQSLGTPILSDGKYGGSKAFVEGMDKKLHLHARNISLPDHTGKKITIEAPLPDHMQSTWDRLGLDENRKNVEFAFKNPK